MLNEEFLNGLLGKEDVSAEDKIKQIIAEHDADTRGLLAKRDELLGNEKKLKEKISGYEAFKAESEKHTAELEEALKKASSEDNRKYYETQLSDLQKKYDDQISSLTTERDQYKTLHLNYLREKAIEEGTKNLNFVPGLKQGFIARVLTLNHFEPKEYDGKLEFVNSEHRLIQDVIDAFSKTDEGKAYIANPSTGGGARGSSTVSGGIGNKTMSRSAYSELQARDPQKAMQFFRDGGKLTD